MARPGQDSSPPAPPPAARTRLALVAYGCMLACTQLLWLTYAPVTAQTAAQMRVSEGEVGDLAALVLVAFVLLGILSGRCLDRYLRATLTVGIGLTVLGAILRALDPTSFGAALAGQSLIAIGQPLVVNAMTKLPALLLPARRITRAIAALSAAQFVGMLVSVGMGDTLYRAGGLALLIGVQAVLTAVCGAVAMTTVWVLPRQPMSRTPTAAGAVLGSSPLWLLAGCAFVGFGLFNAMMTWLDSLLTGLGRPGAAGWSGTAILVAGIAGSVFLPDVAARRGRRREALIVVACIGALAPLALALARGPVVDTVVLSMFGCAAVAGLPITLDLSERVVGAGNAATATGFIMLVGNLGGTVYVLLVQLLLGDARSALAMLGIIALPAVVFAQRLPRRLASGEHEPARHEGSTPTPAAVTPTPISSTVDTRLPAIDDA